MLEFMLFSSRRTNICSGHYWHTFPYAFPILLFQLNKQKYKKKKNPNHTTETVIIILRIRICLILNCEVYLYLKICAIFFTFEYLQVFFSNSAIVKFPLSSNLNSLGLRFLLILQYTLGFLICYRGLFHGLAFRITCSVIQQ